MCYKSVPCNKVNNNVWNSRNETDKKNLFSIFFYFLSAASRFFLSLPSHCRNRLQIDELQPMLDQRLREKILDYMK